MDYVDPMLPGKPSKMCSKQNKDLNVYVNKFNDKDTYENNYT